MKMVMQHKEINENDADDLSKFAVKRDEPVFAKAEQSPVKASLEES